MSAYTNLLNNLEQLKLTKIREILPNYMDSAVSNEKSTIDIMKELTDQEIEFREERARQINLTISHFPFHKTIDDFDFSYQPSINKAQILDLLTLRFIEQNDNILFIGSSGVGKTHLATSIGMEASSKRYSTYFIHFNTLMEKFKKAASEGRIETVVKHYSKYRVLIIDEIGYLPIDKDVANGFFQLVAARYEKRPIILTTNQPLSKWGDVFGDYTLANAIIDRLVHHSCIIKITGQSYRIKGKLLYDEDGELGS
ncbi:MAG: ATP-binding protein [Bacilli bacterium]|nr:ATP-binding protein [Bacilli bacterium]MCF0126387.1 ATP-binding protein [Clostridia bacterium]